MNEKIVLQKVSFTKLLRLAYEMGREDEREHPGEGCSRDFAGDAEKLMEGEMDTIYEKMCSDKSFAASTLSAALHHADYEDDDYDPFVMELLNSKLALRKEVENGKNNDALDAEPARVTAERDAALKHLEECAAAADMLCGYCTHDGRCPIPDDEMDLACPDCYEWRGTSEVDDGR